MIPKPVTSKYQRPKQPRGATRALKTPSLCKICNAYFPSRPPQPSSPKMSSLVANVLRFFRHRSARLSRRVGVHLQKTQPSVSNHPSDTKDIPHLPLAAGSERDVDEAASVLLALVGAALGALGLLLLLDLGGLRLDLACDFTHPSVRCLPSLPIAVRFYRKSIVERVTHRHGRGIRELCPY